ncbi:MAG: PAS domain S-box protein [Bacteroidales bacterium]
MKTTLRILLVEDSEDDALLVMHQINKGGYEIKYERVDTAEMFKAALKEKAWDIILSDYKMPHFDGFEALALLKESGIDLPFIIVSGTIGEEVAVDAMKAGAHDYLMKNNLQRLLPAIARELRESDSRAKRKLLEEDQKRTELLRLSHLQFIESMDLVNQVILRTNDLEQMMSGVLGTVLSIFDCDRVWLLNPCDPDALSFRVPMEITKPEYPGAKMLNVDIPMSAGEARNMREALESDGPVTYTAGTDRPISTAKQFGVQSQMFVPIHPKLGKPWVFGLHQCSYPRIWTPEEKRLFQEIARRLSDALTSFLILHDLRESEERFRLIAENTADTISVLDLNLKLTYTSPSVLKMRGYTAVESMAQSLDQVFTPESVEKINKLFAHQMAVEASGEANLSRPESIELEEYCKDGSTIWVDITLSFIRDANLKPIRILAVARDITARKRIEAVQAAIYRISESAQTAPSLDILFSSIHAIIAGLMPAENFYIALYSAATETFNFSYHADEFDTAPPPRKVGRGLTDYVLRTGKSLLATPEVFEQLVQSGQVESIGTPSMDWLGVPLNTQQGETIGVMAVQTYSEDLRLSANSKNILEFVSTQVAMAVEHKRVEEALQYSEEKYRTLVENLNEVIFTVDMQGCFTYISPAIEQYTGFYTDQIIGQTFTRFIHPDDLPALMASFEHTLAGRLEPFEFRVLNKDGTIRHVHTSSRTLVEDGKVAGLTGVMSDITERKQAEEKLRILSRAVEQSPAAIVITDTAGKIEYTNSKFAEITGYTHDEIIQQNPRVLKSGDMSPEYYKQLWQTITSGKEWHGEFHNRKKNGELYWELASISPILNASGTITHFLAIKEDITDLKKTELELLKAKEKAEASNRLKTEFLHNMSHEVRTPMNGIIGFSQLLDDPDLSTEKQKQFAKIIINNSEQLLRIIDDILEISQLETKQIKAVDQKVCLNVLLLELFSVFDCKAKEKRIPLYIKKGLPDNESNILTDKSRLRKILTNLLENSLKFTFNGFIEMGYQLIHNKIEIYVKDTGIGINQEKQEIIFDRFSKEDKGRSKLYGGLGLGLSIAKENAELLDGEITLKSETGKGSTFYVTIPYRPVPLNNETKEPGIISKIKRKKNDPITILVAEDEEVNYLFIETLLDKTTLNIKTLHAKNGQEAVEICKNNKEINLVLMDIKMPGMNGYEATIQIKKNRPDLPVIAQTAYSTEEDRNSSKLAGCDDYISKPISEKTLNSIISRHLSI